MTVVVRSFNKDGYHKDIVVMDERQIWLTDARIDENLTRSALSGLIGIGAGIDPTKFPEMVRFEIVIRDR